MYTAEIQVRVRYAETDRMGYVYYGNYATYFEVARVEALRNLGFSYRLLEDRGILLPVMNYSVRYFKPAYYDDLLLIKTVIRKKPMASIHFSYEVFNEKDERINEAETTLVFINRETNRPCPAPADFLEAIGKFF